MRSCGGLNYHAPYLPSAAGVGQRQRHQVLGFELAQAAAEAFAFAEFLAGVGAADVRYEQRRHRVPTVAFQFGRRAVIAGHDQHRRIQCGDARNCGVEFFDPFHLGREVAVFAGAVGVFEVDEEEIVLAPILLEHVDLLGQRLGLADDFHADQPGQTLVHRIDGDRRGPQTVHFFVRRQLRLLGEAAQRQAVGFRLIGENLSCLGDKLFGDLGRFLAAGFGDWIERRHAGGLRIGVGTSPPRPGPRKTTTKRCSLTGSTKTSTPGIFTAFSLSASGALSSLAMRPARRSLILPAAVERAIVAADGDVVRAELETDARRFERTAADHELQRIVAEQAPGAPARCRGRCPA